MRRLNLLFYAVICLLFLGLVINLNYNTPFNDEAIYIVIGRLGLFAHDWFTYGAGFWMAGFPYIYPALTALAYQTGGIVGSRLLNVIFALLAAEEIYRLTRQLRLFDPAINQLAGIIAVSILGFSAAGIFTARLATYDMPSFFLLLLAINSFLKAANFNHGKYYFISALSLYAAFLTKIIAAVFYPPLLLFSLLIIRTRDTVHRSLYWKYFVFPIGLGLLIYTLFFSQYLLVFTRTHIDQGTGGTSFDIFKIIWETAGPALVLTTLSLPVLFINGKSRPALGLLLLAMIIPVFHFVLNRVPTLDKHLYLTVAFLAVIIGYAISWLLSRTRIRTLKYLVLPAIMIGYFTVSYPVANRIAHSWPDTAAVTRYLENRIQPEDHLLTESGSAIVLGLYDRLYPPTQVVTFDWIDYSGFTNDEGYVRAVQDQYFDYIQLDSQHDNSRLRDLIHYHLAARYALVHQIGDFQVYAKIH